MAANHGSELAAGHIVVYAGMHPAPRHYILSRGNDCWTGEAGRFILHVAKPASSGIQAFIFGELFTGGNRAEVRQSEGGLAYRSVSWRWIPRRMPSAVSIPVPPSKAGQPRSTRSPIRSGQPPPSCAASSAACATQSFRRTPVPSDPAWPMQAKRIPGKSLRRQLSISSIYPCVAPLAAGNASGARSIAASRSAVWASEPCSRRARRRAATTDSAAAASRLRSTPATGQ